MRVARIDLSSRHPLPTPLRLITATALSLVVSLSVDGLLVNMGTRAFPSTKGYAHFRFFDYATLTIIGVLIACAAWPVVIRISSAPRWLFLRLAVAVTLVLWLPDLYLLARHQPVRAVAVLMSMHLAIAIVTYNLLVRIAPAVSVSAPVAGCAGHRDQGPATALLTGENLGKRTERGEGSSALRLSWVLAVLVGVELALGIATLVVVPTGRPSGWLPSDGTTVYLTHAIVGLPLALGAGLFLVRVRDSTRIYRLGGWIGGIGVTVAGIGGLLTISHPLRLVGMAFMLIGPVVAGFGFLLPALDRLTDDTSVSRDG